MHTADELAPLFVKSRKGISTPVLLVTISIVLVLTVAAIDLAQISHQRHQMQIGADAAALAATAKLHDRGWLYLGPEGDGRTVQQQLAKIQVFRDAHVLEARSEAIKFAGLNKTANRKIVLLDSKLDDPNSDMVHGFVQDPSAEQLAGGVPSLDGGFNSMLVRAKQPKGDDGLPILWMARQVGLANLAMKVHSQAVVDQRLYGFRPLLLRDSSGDLTNVTQVPVPILPIGVEPDIEDLTMFEQLGTTGISCTDLWWAKGPEDKFLVDLVSRPIVVAPGFDGIAEMVIRIKSDSAQPAANNVKTRRGALIGFGNGDTGPAGIQYHCLAGVSADELPSGKIDLSDPHNLPSFAAAYNVKEDDLTTLRAIFTDPSLIGQPRIIPVGACAGDSFVIGGFVAGTIVDCLQDSGDGSLLLVVQPCVLQTPTALTGGDNPRNPWIGKLLLNR